MFKLSSFPQSVTVMVIQPRATLTWQCTLHREAVVSVETVSIIRWDSTAQVVNPSTTVDQIEILQIRMRVKV